MNRNRQLKWDGCVNVRDLGGLAAIGGRRTRWAALVRSDAPSKLTTEGWDALWAYGIRTIISLRTEGKNEHEFDMQVLPSGVEVVSIAIEDLGDSEFVQKWAATDLWCTPLYYQDALMRWPKRHADVVAAFAQAQTGGVLIHCVRGNDRTGIIAMLLLALAGVSAEDIVTDYELSPDPEREEILRASDTSSRKVILDTLTSIDVETYLLAAGLSPSDLKEARERFLEPDEDNRRSAWSGGAPGLAGSPQSEPSRTSGATGLGVWIQGGRVRRLSTFCSAFDPPCCRRSWIRVGWTYRL